MSQFPPPPTNDPNDPTTQFPTQQDGPVPPARYQPPSPYQPATPQEAETAYIPMVQQPGAQYQPETPYQPESQFPPAPGFQEPGPYQPAGDFQQAPGQFGNFSQAPSLTPEEPVRKDKSKNWLVPVIVGVLALGIGGGGGFFLGSDADAVAEVETLTKTNKELDGKLKAANTEIETLQNGMTDEQADLESQKADLLEQQEALETAQAELKTQQQEFEDAKKKNEAEAPAPEEKENTVVITEGRWTVGDDIDPGTYKSTSPVEVDNCYWAITKTGSNGDDIVSNDFGVKGNLTVVLKEGQDFESTSCGTWTKQ